tara:strand:- start:3367 stop:3708 length:342 start_codon:yes stop_codon:yes gene_type:complete
MQTFKEYYQGDLMMNANASSAATGGKSMMRTGRKHENLKRKEYISKCPHVQNVLNGGASQIKLMGLPLQQVLDTYGMTMQPGTTQGCGNSGCEIDMFEDAEGKAYGMLKKKAE